MQRWWSLGDKLIIGKLAHAQPLSGIESLLLILVPPPSLKSAKIDF
jgi:hypothetical protein